MGRYALELKYLGGLILCLSLIFWLDQHQHFEGVLAQANLLIGYLTHLGIVGVFIIALLGGTSILIQVPYTLPLLSFALHGASLEHMLALGLAAGLGSAIGKTISYCLADKIMDSQPHLTQNRLADWVAQQVQHRPQTIPHLIFFFVATPLPDDAALLPLAMVKYGLRPLLLPLYTGKIAHNLGMALIFHQFTHFSAQHLSKDFKMGAALALLSLVVVFLLYQREKRQASPGVLLGEQHIIPQHIALYAIDADQIPAVRLT